MCRAAKCRLTVTFKIIQIILNSQEIVYTGVYMYTNIMCKTLYMSTGVVEVAEFESVEKTSLNKMIDPI